VAATAAVPNCQTAAVPTDLERARSDAEAVTARLGRHRVAVVLGTGWAEAFARLGGAGGRPPIATSELPGFTPPQVPGHAGSIASVPVGDLDVLVLGGRTHLYEGSSPAEVVHPVRVATLAGAELVVLTNAAGSLRAEVGPGEVVVVSDHLNLTGASPLTGDPDGFVDLSDLYCGRRRAALTARVGGLTEGVYAGVAGPQFETPAEIRALRTLGADLVGMSTVLEAIAAAHAGAEVVGLSLVTNLAAGLSSSIDHESILEVGHAATDRMSDVLEAVLADV
jgi:purine-nucleoside phosphorylase